MKRHLQWPALALMLGAAACSKNDDKDMKVAPVITVNSSVAVNTAQWLRIAPTVEHAGGAAYVWLSGEDTISLEKDLLHVFAAPGEANLRLIVKTSGGEAVKDVKVTVNAKAYTNGVVRVFDFVPAPGQFTNKLPAWQAGETQAGMTAKAEEALKKGAAVSLGGFGGYVVMGFDHTIVNVPGQYNFQVLGNAFANWAEPGIIQVSADVNGNGLPDDPWYEIAGSEHSHPKTVHNYEITYYKPAADKVPTPNKLYPYLTDTTYIRWTDNKGGSGYVSKNSFHAQDYFPGWKGDKLILSGTRLRDDNIYDQSGTGSYFVSPALEWGYADNWTNADERSGIKISWAVDGDGKPVKLKGIDFIRVHTGMRAEGGWLGEVSTEVGGVRDLNLR
ncbi:PKD-like domain-containing protein [Chitinophaga lutea]